MKWCLNEVTINRILFPQRLLFCSMTISLRHILSMYLNKSNEKHKSKYNYIKIVNVKEKNAALNYLET